MSLKQEANSSILNMTDCFLSISLLYEQLHIIALLQYLRRVQQQLTYVEKWNNKKTASDIKVVYYIMRNNNMLYFWYNQIHSKLRQDHSKLSCSAVQTELWTCNNHSITSFIRFFGTPFGLKLNDIVEHDFTHIKAQNLRKPRSWYQLLGRIRNSVYFLLMGYS